MEVGFVVDTVVVDTVVVGTVAAEEGTAVQCPSSPS